MASDPIGRLLQQVIELQALSNGTSAEGHKIIERAMDDIVGKLAKYDLTSVNERARQLRLDKFLKETKSTINKSTNQWVKTIRGDVAKIGNYEAKVASRAISEATGVAFRNVPTAAHFAQIVDAQPFQGLILKDWADGMSAKTVREITREVQLGMTRGDSIDTIAKTLRTDVLDMTKRDATAITRTAVNHISNTAQLETYKANSDVITGLRFAAVLDDRTTLECASLDGTVWPIDSDEVRVPPLHYQCRSMLMPVMEGIDLPEKLNYEQWLRQQAPERQNEILGPGRAEIFRSGTTLKQMVDTDGSTLKIQELLNLDTAGTPGAPPVSVSMNLNMKDVAEKITDVISDLAGNPLGIGDEALTIIAGKNTSDKFLPFISQKLKGGNRGWIVPQNSTTGQLGKIVIDNQVAMDLEDFSLKWAQGIRDATKFTAGEIDSVRTIIHESVHASSGMNSTLNIAKRLSRPGHTFIEEGLVERRTRQIMEYLLPGSNSTLNNLGHYHREVASLEALASRYGEKTIKELFEKTNYRVDAIMEKVVADINKTFGASVDSKLLASFKDQTEWGKLGKADDMLTRMPKLITAISNNNIDEVIGILEEVQYGKKMTTVKIIPVKPSFTSLTPPIGTPKTKVVQTFSPITKADLHPGLTPELIDKYKSGQLTLKALSEQSGLKKGKLRRELIKAGVLNDLEKGQMKKFVPKAGDTDRIFFSNAEISEALRAVKGDASAHSSGILKDRIVTKIAQRIKNHPKLSKFYSSLQRNGWSRYFSSTSSKGEAYDVVNEMIRTWASTSANHNPLSLAMQLAVKEEFGLNDAWDVMTGKGISTTLRNQVQNIYSDVGDFFRAFAREQYNLTQEYYRSKGITHVTMFRGMSIQEKSVYDAMADKLVDIQLQPASSFAPDLGVAKRFSSSYDGVVLIVRVPVDQIIGSAQTGWGCFNEREYVLLGGKIKGYVFKYSQANKKDMIKRLTEQGLWSSARRKRTR